MEYVKESDMLGLGYCILLGLGHVIGQLHKDQSVYFFQHEITKQLF